MVQVYLKIEYLTVFKSLHVSSVICVLEMTLKSNKYFSNLETFGMSSVFVNPDYCILALPHLFCLYKYFCPDQI